MPRSIMSHVKAKTCPACGKNFDCMPDTWRFMFRGKRGKSRFLLHIELLPQGYRISTKEMQK